MNTVTKTARAKINLSIDVVGKLENGYHLVRMVMVQVDIADYVTVTLRGDGEITLSSDDRNMPLDETNLAYRAAEKFLHAVSRPELGCHIHIEKHIPMGAGMAGGSTDAAGVINGLNELLGSPLSLERRMEIGVKLGADVPYCIHGGCVLAEGIGEKLTALREPPKVHYVVAKPKRSVSTKWVYEHLDFSKKPQGLNIDGLVEAIGKGDLEEMYGCMGNVLENVSVPECPEIAEYKADLVALGADFSLMSGSGSAVFGMFKTAEGAKAAYELFIKAHPEAEGVWLV